METINPHDFWASKGIGTLPIRYKEKGTFISDGYQYMDNPAPPEIRDEWQIKYKNHGVICGNSLLILDFEDNENIKKIFTQFEKFVAESYVVKTGKGYHVYLFHDCAIPYGKVFDEKGNLIVEFRTGRHYCVGAGSMHPSGAIYTKIGASEPTQIDEDSYVSLVKKMNEIGWKVQMTEVKHRHLEAPTTISRVKTLPAIVASKIASGTKKGTGRNHERFVLAMQLVGMGFTEDEVEKYLLELNKNSDEPDSEEKVRSHCLQIFENLKNGTYQPIILKPNNTTIADVVLRLGNIVTAARASRSSPSPQIVNELVSYIMAQDHYYTFADTNTIAYYNSEIGHYVSGGETRIMEIAQNVIESAGIRPLFGNHMMAEIIGHIKRMTFTKREEFEESIEYICLGNGILNIENLSFVPHSPDFRFLSKLNVRYNPEAICPKIDKFLTEVLQPKDIPMTYEMAGFCLQRDYSLQVAFMFEGEGSNGKSVLLNLFTKFLGSNNVSNIALQKLAGDRFSSAHLYQKYANIYADISSEALEDAASFKTLTGGDRIGAEKKGQDAFFFVNYAKLMFSCNTLPITDDNSDAFFRRWLIISFKNQFIGASANKNLLNEISTEDELSGFLNKALEGLKTVRVKGEFTNTPSIEERRAEYSKKSDSVIAFAMEKIENSLEGYIVKQELYAAYLKYCGDFKLTSVSEKEFFKRIGKTYRVEEFRPREGDKQGGRAFRGIKWKDEGDTDINGGETPEQTSLYVQEEII